MRQKLGAKGVATRQRILDAIVRLGNAQAGEIPSISLICREAGVSTAAFYLYFPDFNAAVIELLHPAAADMERLAEMLAKPWSPAEIYDRSHDFVAAYFHIWERHSVPLRLRRILADAGDRQMVGQRLRSVDPVFRALAAKLRAGRGGGPERQDDHALAVALMHAMSRAAMIMTHNVYPQAIDEAIARMHGYSADCQRRALAHLLSLALQHGEVPRQSGKPTESSNFHEGPEQAGG